MDIDNSDKKNITALADALDELEHRQNTVSSTEFMQYSRLFLKDHKLTNDEISELSNRFITRFNPYQPIKVTDNNGNVLFMIPQLLTPIRSISQEYVSLIDKFRKDGGSDVPKYAADAAKGLLIAISKSQLDEDYSEMIVRLRREYAEAIRSFKKYKNDIDSNSVGTSEVSAGKDISTDKSMRDAIDFAEESIGLSWE